MNNESIRSEWEKAIDFKVYTGKVKELLELCARWWLSKIDQAREEERRRVGQEILGKRPNGREPEYVAGQETVDDRDAKEKAFDYGYNTALSDYDTIVREISGKEKS